MGIEQWSENEYKWVGLLIFGAALMIFIYTFHLKTVTERQSKWPTVVGQVVEFRVDKEVRVSKSNGRRRETTIWTPYCTYSYEVDGVSYTSDKISEFDTSTSSPNEADIYRRLINDDNQVTVYYNLKYPSDAVIRPLPNLITIWVFLVGSALTGLFGLTLFLLCLGSGHNNQVEEADYY